MGRHLYFLVAKSLSSVRTETIKVQAVRLLPHGPAVLGLVGKFLLELVAVPARRSRRKPESRGHRGSPTGECFLCPVKRRMIQPLRRGPLYAMERGLILRRIGCRMQRQNCELQSSLKHVVKSFRGHDAFCHTHLRAAVASNLYRSRRKAPAFRPGDIKPTVLFLLLLLVPVCKWLGDNQAEPP